MPLEGTVRVRISDYMRQRSVILIKARVQRRESCSGVKSRSQILAVLGCKGLSSTFMISGDDTCVCVVWTWLSLPALQGN